MSSPMTDGLLRQRLGIEVLSADSGSVVARMPVDGNRQPAGFLAGGATLALAESVASQAAVLHAASLGRTALGVEVSATHHRSTRAGWAHATCSALHLGRRIASYEVVVTDDAGRRLSTARVTCAVVDRPDESSGKDT